MANYNLTVMGTLSFLSGALTLDPVTGRVSALVPTNQTFSGTVSGRGSSHSNSPVWTFTLNNGGNKFMFTGSGNPATYNGNVIGNPPTSEGRPKSQKDTVEWTADVVNPLPVKTPTKKGAKKASKATAV